MIASHERNEAGRLPGQDERQILDIIVRLRRLPFCEHVPAAAGAADCCEVYGSSPRLFIQGLNSPLLSYEMFSPYATPREGVKIAKKNEVKLPCVTPSVTDRCFLPDLAGLSYLQLRRT